MTVIATSAAPQPETGGAGNAPQPLTGLRVVEFTHMVMGPTFPTKVSVRWSLT
jgi:hypothetical protein